MRRPAAALQVQDDRPANRAGPQPVAALRQYYASLVERRQQIAARYHAALAGLDVERPMAPPGSTSCWFRYVLRCRRPLAPIIEAARAARVGCARPVYRPLHAYLGKPDADFPEAAARQASALSIFCYPALSDANVERVIEVPGAVLPSKA